MRGITTDEVLESGCPEVQRGMNVPTSPFSVRTTGDHVITSICNAFGSKGFLLSVVEKTKRVLE